MEWRRLDQIGTAAEYKILAAVLDTCLGLLDLIFYDGAVVSCGFLGLRKVRCTHPEKTEKQRNRQYYRKENCFCRIQLFRCFHRIKYILSE